MFKSIMIDHVYHSATHFSPQYRFLVLLADVHVCSVVSDSCATWCTITRQASLSIGFPRQEYWSRLPFPLPGHLPNSGIEATSPESPALQADSLPLSHWGSPPPFFLLTYICNAFLQTPNLVLYLTYLPDFTSPLPY